MLQIFSNETQDIDWHSNFFSFFSLTFPTNFLLKYFTLVTAFAPYSWVNPQISVHCLSFVSTNSSFSPPSVLFHNGTKSTKLDISGKRFTNKSTFPLETLKELDFQSRNEVFTQYAPYETPLLQEACIFNKQCHCAVSPFIPPPGKKKVSFPFPQTITYKEAVNWVSS